LTLVVDGFDPGLELELDAAEYRLDVRADSSFVTCLMSAATVVWAAVAVDSAAAQVDWALEAGGAAVGVVPGDAVVVVVVELDGGSVGIAQTTVASCKLTPAADESLSSSVWSTTNAACSLWTCWLAPAEGAEPDGAVVVVVVTACFEETVVDDAVWLASADAKVAFR
jgi:hypothetical protein